MALQKSKQLNPRLTGSFSLSGSFIGDSESTGSFGSLVIDGNATVDGDLSVSQYIKHKGDTNTFINFTDNRIRLNAGGINFLSLEDDGSAPYPATINNGGNRINFRVLDRNSELLLKTDSEAFNVGLYYAGNKKLETNADGIEVFGSVSGSSTSTGSFGHIVTVGDINSSGRIFEQGSSVIDHATAMAIVIGG